MVYVCITSGGLAHALPNKQTIAFQLMLPPINRAL